MKKLLLTLALGILGVLLIAFGHHTKASPGILSVSQVDAPFRYAYFNMATSEQQEFIAKYAPYGIRIAPMPTSLGIPDNMVPIQWAAYVHISFPGLILINENYVRFAGDNQSLILNAMLHEADHNRYFVLSGGTSYGKHIDIYRDVLNLTASSPDPSVNQMALINLRLEEFRLRGCSVDILLNSQPSYRAVCNGQQEVLF